MTERSRAALDQAALALLPANVALMRALIEAPSIEVFDQALGDAMVAHADIPDNLARLDAVRRLWRGQPQAWSLVHQVLASADHASPKGSIEQAVEHWAKAFDRVGFVSPDAGSALYALGDTDLLDRATREIVARLEAWGRLGPERDMVEIGCGSGRFVAALASRVRSIVGLDISGIMLGKARLRCASLRNVRLEQTKGRDLALVDGGSVDLILAVDVMPYLVDAGEDLVADHMRDAARVLRPGGRLVVLNYSYRNDVVLDRADATRLAGRHGLQVERFATGDFALWDGATFQFRKD